ncbi:hypothetical protein [Tessaracoccus massiliensis]|uniref:hypothetical protein n=1 Tax=Tessaracoccus massiliensis TaxID=1522311 RepID=UPI00058AD9AB|nr:hypothetical protein [Tessaracoccus massiliensis]
MASNDGNSWGWSLAGVAVALGALGIDAWALIGATSGMAVWPWGAVLMCLLTVPALIVFGRRDLWAKTLIARVRLGAMWTFLVAAPLLLGIGSMAVGAGHGRRFHGGMEVGSSAFIGAYLAVGFITLVVPVAAMMLRKRLDKWRGHDVPDQSEPYLTS